MNILTFVRSAVIWSENCCCYFDPQIVVSEPICNLAKNASTVVPDITHLWACSSSMMSPVHFSILANVVRGELTWKRVKRGGSEKVEYGVNEGSCWYSLQPDKAEIWDGTKWREGGRGEETQVKESKRKRVRVCQRDRRENMQAQSTASLQKKKCRWREGKSSDESILR